MSNRGPISQSLRYVGRSKRGKVGFDYDTLWPEQGDQPADRDLYALPLWPPR
ncbi:DUF535 domain-containing protein [Ferrimonas sediminicola]|uniref:DUF535 domain-containing protein n=1 Tax=Ferrimonas sediminicola TaxID=2569538 RepID=A0A4U1BCQ4_9GAMM|nr:DUF535 domain-containing protein [Ferrimonas sediminicola]